MCLNRPESVSPNPSMEKMSSIKLVLGVKKFRDHCSKEPEGFHSREWRGHSGNPT